MNKRKGFLRLTIVLSIVVGIIIPIYMEEMEGAFKHTICEAEEKVYESPNPPKYPHSSLPDLQPPIHLQPPIGLPQVQPPPVQPQKVTFTFLTPSNGVVRSTRKVMFNGKFSLFENAKRLNKIFEDKLGKIAVGKWEGAYITYSYKILGEEDVFEWKGFIGMGIKSFILVWLVYAFIRWVIIGFIVGGFKHKT